MSDAHDHLTPFVSSFRQDDPLALIGLPLLRSIQYVHIGDILYCKGESSQTSVFILNKGSLLVTRTLHQCEQMLESYGFCRIHKSYVVNLKHLKEYHKSETNSVILTDGTNLDVSKSYKDHLKTQLNCL